MVRYRRIYDSAIVFFLLDRNDASGRAIPQSFTDIYKMIVNMGYPKVGKDTIQRHLNKLIEDQWVVKLPKEGRGRRYNKTLYIYSPKTKAMIGQRPD